MYVIARGNPFTGLQLVGPFETTTEAAEEGARSAVAFQIVELELAAPSVNTLSSDIQRLLEIGEPIPVRYGSHTYFYRGGSRNDTKIPAVPVECVRGQWYIRMGFAGFNSVANNSRGYNSLKSALEDIRYYQEKSKAK